MKNITFVALVAFMALLQACSSTGRTVAQEEEHKNTIEEKRHHYPAWRVDRW